MKFLGGRNATFFTVTQAILSVIKARSQNFSAAPRARTMNMIK